MSTPKVSVIMPAYNGADFLGEAISSVLNQTYQNLELIIVDDASQDHTSAIVGQFDDPRIQYLVQEVNQGVDAARLRAIRASNGEVLAFLDQDDYFHPDKLQAHVTLLEKHPEIGFTYNARFELNHSANTIREIWRPPQTVTLADLILGFPIAPSDMVVRRSWVEYLDLSKEPALIHGGEYVITGRLFMSGCKFGSVNRALNYRRYHSGRHYSKISVRCQAELAAQERIFSDSRCPAEVIALRPTAFSNTYLIWAYYALFQEETALGQEFLRETVRLRPAVFKGTPPELINFLLTCSIDDENEDHAAILKRIFAQLPPEMNHLAKHYSWAVARGYLLKGFRAVMWDRPEDGRKHFEQAVRLGAQFDEALISRLGQSLLNYETEFGDASTQDKIQALTPYLVKLEGRASVRQLIGCYSVNRAFQSYHAGEYANVPKRIIPAIANNPKYLVNRGVLSIILRSIFGMQANLA